LLVSGCPCDSGENDTGSDFTVNAWEKKHLNSNASAMLTHSYGVVMESIAGFSVVND